MIRKEKVKDYWQKRYKDQGILTTGYIKHNKEQQEAYYKQKKDFIKPLLPDDLGIVFDYGCGKFRQMKDLFKDYIGYDVIDNTDVPVCEFDTLFTANVLQHNEDETVLDILKLGEKAKYIIMYEALGHGKRIEVSHCVSRMVYEYEDLVFLSTRKKLVKFQTHLIHGELHGILIFQ